MALDKNKVLQNAQKLIQKQQWDKALKEYIRLSEAFPNDQAVRLKIGELYARMGKKNEAIGELVKVAESYTKTGFYSRAVAVYKQALKIDESQADLFIRLGDLYQKLQLARESLSQYRIAVNHYEKDGDIEGALQVLKKMVELEPTGLGTRAKIAELKYKTGNESEARQEFEQIAGDIRSQGRIDDLVSFLERVVGLIPKSLGEMQELAKLYVERQEPEKALAKIKILIEAGKRDEHTLGYLVDAYRLQGKMDRVKSVYREMIRIFREEENEEKLRETAEKILELEPTDPEAQEILGKKKAPPGPPPQAPPQVAPKKPPAAPATPRAPVSPEEGTSRRFLAEADIYLKYGLKDKATDALKEVVKVDEKNIEAFKNLLDIFVSESNAAEAKEVAEKLAKLYQESGESGKADEVMAQVADIAAPPEAPEPAASPLDLEIPPDEGVAEAPAPSPAATTVSEGVEIDFPEDDFITGPEVELSTDEGTAPAGETEVEIADEGTAPAGEAEVEIADEGMAPAGETEVEIEDDFLSEEPQPPAVEEEEIEFDIDDQPASEAAPEPETPGPEPEMPPEESVSADQALKTGDMIGDFEGFDEGAEPEAPEISEDLDEAEFYLQQGLKDEAIGIYRKILESVPNEPRALAQLQKLESEVASEEAEPAAAAEAPSDGLESFDLSDAGAEEASQEYLGESSEEFFESRDEIEEGMFDLAEQLEDELGEEVEETPDGPSFDEIFSEFKKGVEREIGEDDTQAHYDLGIAYKEMGLLNDAIQEFTVATADKEKEADCYNMIGLCYLEQGEVNSAIQSYIKGLKSPTISKHGAIELSYELGVAYQSVEKNAEALKVFERIARSDPDFRDIQERIQGLKAAGPAPAEVATEAPAPTAPPEEPSKEAPGRAEETPAEAVEEKKPEEKVRQRKISFV